MDFLLGIVTGASAFGAVNNMDKPLLVLVFVFAGVFGAAVFIIRSRKK